MRKFALCFMAIFFFSSMAVAGTGTGVINIKSIHEVKGTADRLENALRAKGMTIFARINHTEGAKTIGETLRPTELIVFGNPKVGTPLMQCGQSIAIDLPQKALIWEDEAGEVWLSYNDPEYLAKRHGITGCDEVINKIEGALSNFSQMATMR
ncbi:MAG: hypothetical protein COC05_01505 [Gammaproteobacteria bacterium]|nr:MAG: hypothetical protein COC05_01505 [Gammaproteobacteria bacterium]